MIRRSVRLIFPMLLLALSGAAKAADEPMWAWMKGEMAPPCAGVYGIQGVAAPYNRPGIRSDAVSWTDNSGRLWMFGGEAQCSSDYEDFGGCFNDLWRRDPSTGEWSWIKGSKTPNAIGRYGTLGTGAPVNTPGARSGAGAWRDSAGRLWMFGGLGKGATDAKGGLEDLWRLDPATAKWAWMKGSNSVNQPSVYGTQGSGAQTNSPGARRLMTCWTDPTGKFWLFGGLGIRSGGYYTYEVYLNDLWCYDPATNNWTWVKGSSTPYQDGTYGTQGVAAPANTPGSRSGALGWTDNQGRLWLFGGVASNKRYFNDLWCFDPATKNWTWLKGSKTPNQGGVYGNRGTGAAGNIPGARSQAIACQDAGGKVWLYSGIGYDGLGQFGTLNDLWRYDPTSGNWSWMAGNTVQTIGTVYGTRGVAAPANSPGGRSGGVAWCDSAGRLCLLGGLGDDATQHHTQLNDLWRFDPATGFWTWLDGSSTPLQSGCYGTQGVAAVDNMPPPRYNSATWKDNAGQLWMFGGRGHHSNPYIPFTRNDLWCFNPVTLNWTWVKGSQEPQQAGVYGAQGTPAPTNMPGSRMSAAYATDASGRFWMFGGQGMGAVLDDGGDLNDLWRYDPATGEWTWLKGSDATNQNGEYGSQGVTAPDNTPGGRYDAVAWIDNAGRFWLFGGYGYDSLGMQEDWLNDLWCYDPATGNWTWKKGSKSINQYGVYGAKGSAAPANTPGARYGAIAWTDASGRLWLFGGHGLTASNGGDLNDLWRYDPATDNWAWVGGSSTRDAVNTYGPQGEASPLSMPGGRKNAASWTDSSGRCWIFGGDGPIISNTWGSLDDLWRFDPATGQWTWLKGNNSQAFTPTPIYGTPGIAASENTPGPISETSTWIMGGKLWLFGGFGHNAAQDGELNSLWALQPGRNAATRDAWRWLE